MPVKWYFSAFKWFTLLVIGPVALYNLSLTLRTQVDGTPFDRIFIFVFTLLGPVSIYSMVKFAWLQSAVANAEGDRRLHLDDQLTAARKLVFLCWLCGAALILLFIATGLVTGRIHFGDL